MTSTTLDDDAPAPAFYTVADVAKILNMHERTAREMLAGGRLPCRRFPGTRPYLSPRTELHEYIRNPGPLEVRELPDGGLSVRPVS